LALAICHEGEGKTATAWAEFSEVASEAAKRRQTDRQAFASRHAKALADTLSHLTVVVPAEVASVSGLEITKDGELVTPTTWGAPLPVDPGKHTVEARAPGRSTWRATVEVSANGGAQTVDVQLAPAPPVEPAPVPVAIAPPPPPPPATETVHPTRTLGIVLGSVALASLGTGIAFGAAALSKNSDATSLCSRSHCDNPTAVHDSRQARDLAVFADVGIGVGVVALGAAAYLFLRAAERPVPSTGAVEVAPLATRHGLGLGIASEF
jgi:hypothetical protein